MVAVKERGRRAERSGGGNNSIDQIDAAIAVESAPLPGFRIYTSDKHSLLWPGRQGKLGGDDFPPIRSLLYRGRQRQRSVSPENFSETAARLLRTVHTCPKPDPVDDGRRLESRQVWSYSPLIDLIERL